MSLSYLAVAIQAALQAGAVARNMIGQVNIEHKGRIDLVTDADKAVEREIVRILRGAFPEHAILAEETGTSGDNAYCWYIDPIDGTTNYAHGFPVYAVSIGLAEADRLLVGVVYLPATDELFTAELGGGAMLNGVPLRVSDTETLLNSLLVTGFPYTAHDDSDNNLDHYGNFLTRCQGIRRTGSAAYDLVRTAQGCFDGYWESGLYAYDMAAGALIVQEAGGVISDYHGGPWSLHGGKIVAANPHIHQAMLDVLKLGKTGMHAG
jgi:myo-inositol-1(or 4)-monophosphatase